MNSLPGWRPNPIEARCARRARPLHAALALALSAGCASAPTHDDAAPIASRARDGSPTHGHEGAPADADDEPLAAALAQALDPTEAAASSHTDGIAHAAQTHAALCSGPMAPDPRDAQLPSEPQIIKVGAAQDVVVPQLVLDWMKETQFAEAHDGWHLIRRWDQGCRKSNAPAAGCAAAQRLINQGLWRADVQQGAPGDGVAFLMAHRHMIHTLKEVFPKHAALFSGFKRVPKTRNDPENPMPWKNISWTSSNLRGFEILENIEKNLSMFPNEDELGHFIQGSIRWTPERPTNVVVQTGSALHGALHGQWNVAGSPAALINQAVDVRNFIFWKLHGWIDDVWERYRVAKGLTQSAPDYQKLLREQCMEMHALEPRNRQGGAPKPGGVTTPTQDPNAKGFFATNVKPFLDSICTGCHSANGGAAAGLVLGGDGVSIGDVVSGIVNVDATNGEYKLIVPRDPDKSWLFLKASGNSERVTCASNCDRTRMPPAGTTLNATQLAALRQWITNGAKLD